MSDPGGCTALAALLEACEAHKQKDRVERRKLSRKKWRERRKEEERLKRDESNQLEREEQIKVQLLSANTTPEKLLEKWEQIESDRLKAKKRLAVRTRTLPVLPIKPLHCMHGHFKRYFCQTCKKNWVDDLNAFNETKHAVLQAIREDEQRLAAQAKPPDKD